MADCGGSTFTAVACTGVARRGNDGAVAAAAGVVSVVQYVECAPHSAPIKRHSSRARHLSGADAVTRVLSRTSFSTSFVVVSASASAAGVSAHAQPSRC